MSGEKHSNSTWPTRLPRVSQDQASMLIDALEHEEHDPPIPLTIDNRSTAASSLQRKGFAIRVGMRLELTEIGRAEARAQRERRARLDRKVAGYGK